MVGLMVRRMVWLVERIKNEKKGKGIGGGDNE